MKDILFELGLSNYDFALLVFCPIGSMLGSFAHVIMLSIDAEKFPKRGEYKIVKNQDEFLMTLRWYLLRLLLGGILGLVYALYFIGTLQDSITAVGKLTAFSILIGYAAPKLWITQEKVLMKKIEERVNIALSDKSLNKTSPTNTDKDK